MISATQLASIFKPLIDKQAYLIIILDSCRSGGFVSTGDYASGLPDTYDPANLYADISVFDQELNNYFKGQHNSGPFDYPTVWVVSAAGSAEDSYDDNEHQHGAFTWYLLKAGMKKENGQMFGDFDLNGMLTLQEIYRYSLEQLEQNWNKYWTGTSVMFKPHLSGNPLDILLF